MKGVTSFIKSNASRRLLVAAAAFLALAMPGRGFADNILPESELTILNNTIKSAPLYMREKTAHLDSITRMLGETPDPDLKRRWELSQRLTEEYLVMRADSALKYSDMAIHIALAGNMPDELYRSRIARVNALSTGGVFTRALSEFNALDTVPKRKEEQKILYWIAGRKLFGNLAVYMESDKQFANEYNQLHLQYDDSLLMHMPAGNDFHTFFYGERLVITGQYDDAKAVLGPLVRKLPEESNLYGMAAYQLGWICKCEGDQTGYATWLAKAAISDIKGCVKDGMALPALAEWLYDQGELNTAFQYINFALQDAVSGNVRMRAISIAGLLPAIDEAYRSKINASRDELMVYFILVTFLLLLSVSLVMVLIRNLKRGRESSAKLARTARLQESYIGNFIGLSSTYANRLEALRKLVVRKLAAGQSDELLKVVNSGKFSDAQNEEFYKVFDAAFLDICPDFISNINDLLRPEERLELKKEREMTPELRIYAFVRLGIDESTRIAQILNYSVSTVYAYRNRMRNRALDRDSFDQAVMDLGRRKLAE